VQDVLADVLKENAAGSMFDTLRNPGRPRRKKNVDGVREGQLREARLALWPLADSLAPRRDEPSPATTYCLKSFDGTLSTTNIRDDEHAFDAWQLADDSGQPFGDIDLLAGV
jgi:hypothetical protein